MRQHALSGRPASRSAKANSRAGGYGAGCMATRARTVIGISLLHRRRGDEVDEVAVGVTEQERPVAPRHRGGLVDEVLDEAGQVLVHAVHVVGEELDDHGAVVARTGGAGRERRDGAGAADREGGAGGPELGEVLVGSAHLRSCGSLVEVGEAGDVTPDDADRDEVHGDLPVCARAAVRAKAVVHPPGTLRRWRRH